jgi:uncharacterized protein YwgA
MDSRLIVLKLFVEELGLDVDIDNFEDRKTFQKAVYLGQLSGIDLGYRYGWYLRGPYSTGLARDYYQLAGALELEENAFQGKALNDRVKQSLHRFHELFRVPPGVQLSRSEWLELLASWHYLRKVSPKDRAEARTVMNEKKPVLAPHVPAAEQALERHALL